MIKPIVKDTIFLGGKSGEATENDRQIITDLKDTLAANRERCVGMAANMIGYRKRIIIVAMGPKSVVMVNPVILQKSFPYEAEEGCLSLEGVRKARRFRKIRVRFLDEDFRPQTKDYEGFAAQIIQHECDHLEGVII